MTPDDDQKWLDALAGRAASDSAAGREGATLRGQVLRMTSAQSMPPAPARDGVREMTLIARARGEGLLPAPPRAPWRWPLGWNAGFAVATLAVIAVAVGFYMGALVDTEMVDPEAVVRGAPDGIVRITSPDPARLKQELIEDLRTADVVATGYEVLGRHGIDADLPQPLTEAVRQVLDKHHIPPPQDGVLRVEIVSGESE